jgi:hypothetical protein
MTKVISVRLQQVMAEREVARENLALFYAARKKKIPWTDKEMTQEQYRLSIEAELERCDRVLEALN